MAGFNPLFPRRIVVDEVITTGANSVLASGLAGLSGFAGKGVVGRYNSWATARPPSSSAFVMATQQASTSTTTTITTFTSSAGAAILNSPDYPRAVRVCPSTSAFVSAASSSFMVLVTGTDQFGNTVTDTISTGGGAGPIDGQIAFKTITSIVLPACSSPLTPFTISLSNIFGLDRTPSSVASVIRGAVNGTAEATAPVVGAPSTSGTGTPATGPATITRSTVKFSTAATSSAGALLEVLYVPQDVAHI